MHQKHVSPGFTWILKFYPIIFYNDFILFICCFVLCARSYRDKFLFFMLWERKNFECLMKKHHENAYRVATTNDNAIFFFFIDHVKFISIKINVFREIKVGNVLWNELFILIELDQ